MKLILLLTVLSLAAQTPPAGTQKKAASNSIPPEAGDDVRGYNDTPQLPGQKWRVHDLARPRPVAVTPAPYIHLAPPSDAIALFDGKDLSHWTGQARGGTPQEPTWKVEN